MNKQIEALKLALEALENAWLDASMGKGDVARHTEAIAAIREALAEQTAQQPIHCKDKRENGGVCPHHNLHCGWPKCNEPAQQQEQKLEFVSPGGGYVPAIPRPIPLDWKLVPRKATPEMLRAMDECAQEGYDERLYEGMASSVYMAAWDASPVLGTLPSSEKERSMMDIIVGNLVREGINKHRARELAEHFIKQCNYTNGYCTGRIDLLAEQKAQQRINCKSKRDNNGVCPHHNLQCGWPKCNESEQPAQQQEPVEVRQIAEALRQVGLTLVRINGGFRVMDLGPIKAQTASPPASKPWVGLTDEEIEDAWPFVWRKHESVRHFAIYHAIEAKLKDKNGY